MERQQGLVARHDIEVFAPGSAHDADTVRYLERTIKFLLRSIGGSSAGI